MIFLPRAAKNGPMVRNGCHRADAVVVAGNTSLTQVSNTLTAAFGVAAFRRYAMRRKGGRRSAKGTAAKRRPSCETVEAGMMFSIAKPRPRLAIVRMRSGEIER